MKIATLHDGSRDGQLVVVSRDLATAHFAAHIAGTLQRVLDDWNFISPQLEDLYATLNGGKARHAFAFDPQACMAPLPRAHLWAPGAAPARSDGFLRPATMTPWPDASDLPCRIQLAAVTGDVAAGADADTALDGVRLLLLAASWGPAEALRATAFCPAAVTPDEFGPGWQAGVPAAGPAGLAVRRHGVRLALAAPPADTTGFGPRIAALAQWQALGAGSVVGGPALDAAPGEQKPQPGPGGPRGSGLQLELVSGEGHSVFGTLAVQAGAPAGQPGVSESKPAAAAPAPDPAAP